jgi:hypothetical protein
MYASRPNENARSARSRARWYLTTSTDSRLLKLTDNHASRAIRTSQVLTTYLASRVARCVRPRPLTATPNRAPSVSSPAASLTQERANAGLTKPGCQR